MNAGDHVLIKHPTEDTMSFGIGTVVSCFEGTVTVYFPLVWMNLIDKESSFFLIDDSKNYCDCNSDFLCVGSHVDTVLDASFGKCPKCGLFYWRCNTEEGFRRQLEYEEKKNQNCKMIKIGDVRYTLYCACNSDISMFKNDEFDFIGCSAFLEYSPIKCDKCHSHKFALLKPGAYYKQLAYETRNVKPVFCGCNSSLDSISVNDMWKEIEDTEEFCPKCGYFKWTCKTTASFMVSKEVCK